MTAPVDLDARYGRSRSRRRGITIALVALVGALLIGGAVWIAWIGLFSPSSEVEGQAISYSRTDDGVRIRAQVSAPVGRAVACVVEADAADGQIIGWKTVVFGASDQRTRGFVVELRATATVQTGLIRQCWLT